MANLPEELELNDKPVKSDRAGYFKRIISDLEENKIYELQFRWKYEDGTYGPLSLIKRIITPSFELGADPDLPDGSVVGIPGAIKITWNGKDISGKTVESDKQFDRADVHISGTSFGDGTKPAGNFKKAGTSVFKCEPGIYIVQIKIYNKDGKSTFFSTARTVTVPPVEEEVQPPVTPKGFSSERVLSGIEVAWDGTYTGNAEWYGFQAINIYAGTSATAISGTYIKVGQMTANKTGNKIVIPVDGTYVKYDQPVYIHASSINKKAQESAIVANVTSQSTGARSAIPSDLSDNIITNQKLVDGAVNAAKIATAAITEVKIDNNAITAAKIAAGAITEVKIDTGAITSAKIATGAITETKIAADAITAPKIAAGSIEAGKIAAGAITAEKIAASAIDADKIATNAITAIKIAAGAVEAGKIAAGAITADKIAANAIETSKIAADAITSSKIVAGAITAAKIDSLAITSDKIAASAITASKIQAGEIDVTKLSAGTLSVNNLEAGSLKTTTYIRTGTAGGGRIDIAASASSGLPAGLYIYNSGGTAVFEAPLGGGITVTGHLKATQISTAKFNVDVNGILTASDVDLTGTIKANGGTIGGLSIGSNAIQNTLNTFRLDSSGMARFGSASGNSLIINPSANIDDSWIFFSTNGGQTGSNKFRVTSNGTLYMDSAVFSGNVTSTATIQGGTLSGALVSGGNINITGGYTLVAGGSDSDSGAGNETNISTASNSFSTLYSRAPFGGYSAINCVGFNAVGLISTNTAGVVSSWYPYYDGAADLGVKYSPTYNTQPYRWRNLRLTDTGNIIIGGDGTSDTPSTTVAGRPVTRLYASGRIFANSLNEGATYTGTANIGQVGGHLRVVSSSTINVKDNIGNIYDYPEIDPNLLLQIPVRSFKYKLDKIAEDDERYNQILPGFIAEELDEIYPVAVDRDENGNILRWNSFFIIPGMVALLQKQNEEIQSLKQRLDVLEA